MRLLVIRRPSFLQNHKRSESKRQTPINDFCFLVTFGLSSSCPSKEDYHGRTIKRGNVSYADINREHCPSVLKFIAGCHWRVASELILTKVAIGASYSRLCKLPVAFSRSPSVSRRRRKPCRGSRIADRGPRHQRRKTSKTVCAVRIACCATELEPIGKFPNI
jgi:hypothetical protein